MASATRSYSPLRRSLAALSVATVLSFFAFFLAGCDMAGPAGMESGDAPPEPTAAEASGSEVSVALLTGFPGARLQGAEGGGGRAAPYLCTANVIDPSAEKGYRTWNLALSFPDSVKAEGGATTALDFGLHLAPGGGPDALDSYRLADSSFAARVKCRLPRTRSALNLFAARVQDDLGRQFGEENYRLAKPAQAAETQSARTQSTGAPGPGGEWARTNTMLPDPISCPGGISAGCNIAVT